MSARHAGQCNLPMQAPTERHYLAPLFEPASVAIIGASERAGTIGAVLMRNMLDAGAAMKAKLKAAFGS